MALKPKERDDLPSLENLIESRDLGIEILHPGGLAITKELASMCKVRKDSHVLEVASGTGESACFLAKEFGSAITGIDISEKMIERAKDKCKGPDVRFTRADAEELPFADNAFDVVISECTMSLLDKEKVLREMFRVVKSGGYIGIHDLYWKEDAPAKIRQELATLENERPETIQGWTRLFRKVGIEEIKNVDKSGLLPEWMRESRKKIGFTGYLKILADVVGRWGIKGVATVLKSQRIFSSRYIGYCIVVGKKP